MEVKQKDLAEILDLFESIAVKALIPYMEQIGGDMEPKVAARNMLGKVGTRIAFGNELVEKAFLRV